MPISVQWGAPAAPGLAALAQALIGERTRAADRAARQVTARGGGYGPDVAKQQELARYRAELESQQLGQRWQQEQAELAQRAELERQNFDYEYSQKQKHRIANIENARSMLWANPAWSEKEKQRGDYELTMARAGIRPSAKPKDPNAIEYPEGQGIGQTWTATDGSERTRNPDGKEVVLLKFEETKEGMLLQQQMKREDALARTRSDLAKFQIQEVEPKRGKTIRRFLKPEEKRDMMEEIHPWLKEERETKELEKIAKIEAEKEAEMQQLAAIPWYEKESARQVSIGGGKTIPLNIEESDKEFPPQVGYSRAFVRTLLDTYKQPEAVPPELREALSQAMIIYKAHLRQVSQ